MKPQSLTIPGDFFRSGYSVYVVEIKHPKLKQSLFYVGQTGDAAHLTARSPFYRMGGHFSYQKKSTENQLFRAISKIEEIPLSLEPRDERAQIEEFLVEATVSYHVFQLHDFDYNNEDRDHHRDKRHTALAVETALLKLFRDRYGDTLLNKSDVSLKRALNSDELQEIDEIVLFLRDKGIEL